ncbi:hypothetical protein TUM4445_24050 [Shewanella sp. MBTL60-112-B2]|nr:hypothetical protein TUM4445_24050 [Shewanella sp. MBTL60-112-B2]
MIQVTYPKVITETQKTLKNKYLISKKIKRHQASKQRNNSRYSCYAIIKTVNKRATIKIKKHTKHVIKIN